MRNIDRKEKESTRKRECVRRTSKTLNRINIRSSKRERVTKRKILIHGRVLIHGGILMLRGILIHGKKRYIERY